VRRERAIGVLVAAVLVAAASGAPVAQELHPAELAPLTPESDFPRFTPEELAAAGYPDHLHVWSYPGFEPFTDAEGETYGPFSLSRGTKVIPREGLETAPGHIRYRGIHLIHNPEFQPFQVMPMVEQLDWARRHVAWLIGHDRDDTLTVVNPDDLEEYRERTGYAFHRLYRYDPQEIVIEAAFVLFARGLVSHAAHHLVATWLLDDLAGETTLPAWLDRGLASYLAEDGTHFLNYLAMYRPNRSVIMDPRRAEEVLAGPPDPDDETDKVQFRMAGYAAFLMAWELVEHRGGLDRVLELYRRAGEGEDPDEVSRDLYDADLTELAVQLDPTLRPEPVGEAVQPRAPQRPPR
jgi:hypothetical protein